MNSRGLSLSLGLSLASPIAAFSQNAMTPENHDNSILHNIDKPNVIMIYADDLGMGMISCMGQKHFKTPNIDRLFHQGTRFSHAYGCMVSAASRASILTGYFDIRKDKINVSGAPQLLFDKTDDSESTRSALDAKCAVVENDIDNSDVNLPQGDLYLPQIFQKAGYVTAQIGKLDYGWTATRGQMTRHGWDHYYGYLDHVGCHGYYPPYLFEDGKLILIEGNTHKDCAKTRENETPAAYAYRWNMEGKMQYAQDLFDEKMAQFIADNKDKPFFLHHPTLLPHGPVMVTEVYDEVKHNPALSQIEKEYASMIIRLDKAVGRLIDEVEKQGISDRTIFIFTSDNGHEIYYAQAGRIKKPYGAYDDWNSKYYSDSHGDIFNGNGGLRGFKRQNSEGGPRVPMAIYWPGHIPAGAECNQFVAHIDLLPTFADLLHVNINPDFPKDGVSILSTIVNGTPLNADRYYAYSSYQGPAIVDNEGYKVRYNTTAKDFDMYFLLDDPQERRNVAIKYPQRFEQMKKKLIDICNGDINNGICYY